MQPPIQHPGSIAIACGAGGFKGAFLSGVLTAFEAAGLRAGAYAAASSAVIPAAYAAFGQVSQLGVDYWLDGLQLLERQPGGMSAMVLAGLESHGPAIVRQLFASGAPRFFIVANEVVGEAMIGQTQGPGARRLGRRLLLEMARGDGHWAEENLELQVFTSQVTDSPSDGGRLHPLTPENFIQVAYASSRMLHAWDLPAWVEKRAYVDAAYTCNCPAVELAELGYPQVIALVNQPLPAYRDLFERETIPENMGATTIHILAPAYDPVEEGVDFTRAIGPGLVSVYEHGLARGREFMKAREA